MGKKRSSGSPKLSRSARSTSRSVLLADSSSDDDERQQLLVNQRALSRRLSYNAEQRSLPRPAQIEYLNTCIAGREWEEVGDLLKDLLEAEDDDPVKVLALLRPDVTQVFLWAVADGQERVVKLFTERDLQAVDAKSFQYQNALYEFSKDGNSGAVRLLMRYFKKAYKNSPGIFGNFVNARDDGSKTKNTALHWACEKGRLAVVKELMDDAFLPELDLNARNGDGDTPLHVAITKALGSKNLDIVDILCTKGKHKKLHMNKKNRDGKTPYQRLWEAAMDNSRGEEERDAAELLRQMFLKQKPVNDRRDDAYRERDYLQTVATSLLVGATLLVSVTFGGFIQMPRLPPEEDFIEPGAEAFNPNSNLGSRKYWYIRAIDIFRCSNTITFFMSIISIVASIRVMISRRDRVFIEKENCDLERSIRVGSLSLMLATAVAVVAFVSSGLANIPVAESGWSMVISNWDRNRYVPLFRSTTLTTSLLGALFVAPLVVMPLWKDYYFFFQEYARDVSSLWKLFTLLFATALISSVLLLIFMVVLGMEASASRSYIESASFSIYHRLSITGRFERKMKGWSNGSLSIEGGR
ncbi:hypothetical protein R1flu_000424 [Riccia fluitans]|uniref:PGG domain-containing protein n=1 Tax=Riccia fluitans TaxID=41844 RepID=A0ABD1Y0E5_9MARC